MKKLFAAILLSLAFAVPALADRIDIIKSYDPVSYCEYISVLFGFGVQSHSQGFPLIFVHNDRPCATISTLTPGIHLCDMNAYTAQEKKFVTEHITNGYTYAAETLAKSGDAKIPADAEKAALEYFDVCLAAKAEELYQRNEDKRSYNIKETSGFRHVGSSHPSDMDIGEINRIIHGMPRRDTAAEVTHPDGQSETMCQFRTRSAEWIMVVKVGLTKEEFWERNPLPEGWRKEIIQAAHEVVDAAFAWTLSDQEFVEHIAATCGKPEAEVQPEDETQP